MTLLRYGLMTDPFPLQASPDTGDLDTATLTVVVSNPNQDPDRHPVTLRYLSIVIPVQKGTQSDSSDLAVDAKIDSEVPAGWQTPPDKVLSPGKAEFVFHPNEGGGQIKGAGLNFVLKNIKVSRETGTVEIDVIEGSDGDPATQFSITKFRNGWGAVNFSLNPTDVPYQGATTLQWAGPDTADYSIEYSLDGVDTTVPAVGSLGSQGVYPGPTDPPLSLDQTTVFTLRVSDTIDGKPHSTLQQLTATVVIPAPQIISFETSPTGFSASDTQVALSWQTANVSELTIVDVTTVTGTQAAQGSLQLTRGTSELFQAQGFGVSGYTGPPAAAQACFGQVVSTGTIQGGSIWMLEVEGRSVFNLHVDVSDNFDPDDESQSARVWLELLQGVNVADLGMSGPATVLDDLHNANYTTSLPQTDIYDFTLTSVPDLRIFRQSESYPLAAGSTWGVQFSDGTEIVVWFEGANFSNGAVTANFVWFGF